MNSIEVLLADHPFFSAMPAADLATLSGCAWNEHVEARQPIARSARLQLLDVYGDRRERA